jgi:periplasmic protein TonB
MKLNCGNFSGLYLTLIGAGFIISLNKTNNMNNEAILHADVLDIVFNNRNQQYGAYTLRKFYPQRISKSLFIICCMAGVFSIYAFIPNKKPGKIFTVIETGFASPPLTSEKKQEEQKPKKVKSNTNQQKFIANFFIAPKTDTTDKLDALTDKTIGSSNLVVKVQGSTIVDGFPEEVFTSGGGKELPKEVETPKLPVENPDVQASFPGGDKALVKFLQDNLRSPADLQADEFVQVKVKFVVDFDGDLQHFEVVKDGGAAFNAEVVRVLKKMPKWNPGKMGGTKVPAYYTIPVKFSSTE